MIKKRWTEEELGILRSRYLTEGRSIQELISRGRSESSIGNQAFLLGLYSEKKRPILPLSERFWKFVDKSGDCWLWTGANQGKYGLIGIGGSGRQDYAHIVSWKLHFGEIPKKIFVLHDCDNTLCVRPDHLFLGTHQDNMDDMKNKGRTRTVGLGFRDPDSRRKVTPEIVENIRRLYAEGDTSYPKLGEMFGISERHVARIVRREEWK